jgi:outer membrane protein OmpA-like peptidoglycan-associated protein
MPIRIREVRIGNGTLDFTDLNVQPNFAAKIMKLDGTITGLSSAWDARAKVDLEGQLGEFSPVTIAGELQPFAFDRHTDLRMAFENISLPIFNPYSGPVAGYNIAKGKLTTRLHYRIEERKLDAQHNIRIDQLEWGEANATQGEATLPVKLATSLLKDRDGVIKLDVPVGGTLDDPTFRVGPIIWQVIKNIIVKAVTAPFALLGSLFAGAEEAQFVDFAPGEAALDPATAERLDALAKSLAERPELKLDVPIGALPDIDRPALTERAYQAALADAIASRKSKDAQPDAPAPTFETLEPNQRIEVLAALLTKQTGAEPALPEPTEPPEGTSREETKALRQAATLEFLEQAARAGVVVQDSALEQLGEERARSVEKALLGGGALEPTRVFKVREGKVSAQDGKVRFELGLE